MDHARSQKRDYSNPELCPQAPNLFKEFNLPAEERLQKFLKILEEEVTQLKRDEKLAIDASLRRRGLEHESSYIPEPSRLDRILRYEAMNSREFGETLNLLLLLQSTRRSKNGSGKTSDGRK
jgi:hypothetical protein